MLSSKVPWCSAHAAGDVYHPGPVHGDVDRLRYQLHGAIAGMAVPTSLPGCLCHCLQPDPDVRFEQQLAPLSPLD